MTDASFETIRPVLVSVDGDESVRVAVEHSTELFVAEEPAVAPTQQARAAASAAATAAALGQMTPSAVAFSLDWCELLPTREGLPPVVAAMVGVEVAGVPKRYAGAVVADGDVAVSAAKAVLDALNRRLGVSGL